MEGLYGVGESGRDCEWEWMCEVEDAIFDRRDGERNGLASMMNVIVMDELGRFVMQVKRNVVRINA